MLLALALALAATPLFPRAQAPALPTGLPKGPAQEPAALWIPIPSTQVEGPPESKLSGFLLDETGAPLSEVFLTAVPVSLLAKYEQAGLTFEHRALHRSLPHGSAETWSPSHRISLGADDIWVACSQPNGAFAFGDVSPAEYAVFTQPAAYAEAATSLTDRPLRPGALPVTLVLPRAAADAQRTHLSWPFDEGPRARIEVTVCGPGGAPYPFDSVIRFEHLNEAGEVVPPPELLDSSLANARILASRYEHAMLTPWLQTDLRPGRYRVSVSSEELSPILCDEGWRPALAPFAPAAKVIEVEDGAVLQLRLTLREGGRLRLALPTPVSSLHPEVQALIGPGSYGLANPTSSCLTRGLGAKAVLIAPTGEEIQLRFYAPHLMLSYHFDGILPGTSCLSETIVPPGRYRLRIAHPELAADAVDVEIKAGEITSLKLPLR